MPTPKQPARGQGRIDWRGADLRGLTLTGVNMDNADLRACDLRGCDISHGSFRYADLRGALMQGVNAQHATFYAAKMQGVEAADADFRFSDLRQANMAGAYVQGARLPEPAAQIAGPAPASNGAGIAATLRAQPGTGQNLDSQLNGLRHELDGRDTSGRDDNDHSRSH